MRAVLAALAVLIASAALAQPLPAPEQTIVVYPNRPIVFQSVNVGTSSTTILLAPVWRRTSFEIWNTSGRVGGSVATDIFCQFGSAAVVGQGFAVLGAGGYYARAMPAILDGRDLNCIASAPVTVTLGSAQL